MPKTGDYQVVKEMLDVTAKSLIVNEKGDAVGLRQAAMNFLEGVNAVVYANQEILNKELSNTHSLKDIYMLMRDSTKITQHSIGLQYLFEANLNKFLGREIFLLYVTDDGTMLYADELIASNIYQLASKNKNKEGGATGRGGTINIGQRRLDYLKEHPPEIVRKYRNMLKTREQFYKGIKDEVLKRWNNNHNSKNWAVQEDPSHSDTFYWIKGIKENGSKEWSWSAQINRGHIYETYASLIWQNKQKIQLDPKNETDIGKYWEYMKAHNLNNVSGIVQGDVSFFLNPNIQFAVKSGQFSTAAIGTYLDVATQLVSQNFNITAQNVQNLLKNVQAYQNKVLEYGLHKSQQIIDQELVIKK